MIDTTSFTLSDWLSYLESRHFVAIQMGLDRVRRVAEALDLSAPHAKVITVAGTNGKGSTVAALTTLYHAAGYSVGTYTSPHLLAFNERICVDQIPISDQDLCLAFKTIHAVPESQCLTYFEMTTLAALWHFKQISLDIIILEVGMGGRLDATNIIDADAVIITTIDLDHQAFLGNTKEAIAYEKAGVMRSKQHMIYADFDSPESIRKFAKIIGANDHYLGFDYTYDVQNDIFVLSLSTGERFELPKPRLNLKAMAAALTMTFCLNEQLPMTMDQRVSAIRSVYLPGRLDQKMDKKGVHYLFDVAHNPQAVGLLADYLEKNKKDGQVYAIFSGLKDKDLSGLIKPFETLVDEWYPALLTGERAANKKILQMVFDETIKQVPECYDEPISAFDAARSKAKAGDWIVVYGSFLTVGPIMAHRMGG